MDIVTESVFVGIYSTCIYLAISPFVRDFYTTLIIAGFLKHYLGYVFTIHDYYRNNCANCVRNRHNKRVKYTATPDNLVAISLMESVAYLIVGLTLSMFISSPMLLYFFIGFCLHIVAEYAGIHGIFCTYFCNAALQL